jgi:hypothetical protein
LIKSSLKVPHYLATIRALRRACALEFKNFSKGEELAIKTIMKVYPKIINSKYFS